MPEQRIIFEKAGKAKYISHLDLLHTFQRVFVRAGVKIRHSEGFNPHPKISIALPLSVGQESGCELLDFALLSDIALSEVPDRLNAFMPEGLRVLEAYDAVRKIAELKWLSVTGSMIYDSGAPPEAVKRLSEFFSKGSIVISKRSKRGISDFDIKPCIMRISFDQEDGEKVKMHAVISVKEPVLNPDNLINALIQLSPGLAPDFTTFRRSEIFDGEVKVFR